MLWLGSEPSFRDAVSPKSVSIVATGNPVLVPAPLDVATFLCHRILCADNVFVPAMLGDENSHHVTLLHLSALPCRSFGRSRNRREVVARYVPAFRVVRCHCRSKLIRYRSCPSQEGVDFGLNAVVLSPSLSGTTLTGIKAFGLAPMLEASHDSNSSLNYFLPLKGMLQSQPRLPGLVSPRFVTWPTRWNEVGGFRKESARLLADHRRIQVV